MNARSFVLMSEDTKVIYKKRTEKLKLHYFPATFYIIRYYKNCSENGMPGNLTGCY